MHTLTFATWTDVPAHIRSHCMERLSPGVYRHARLSLVLVMLDQTNTPEGVRVLMDDVTRQIELRSQRAAANA